MASPEAQNEVVVRTRVHEFASLDGWRGVSILLVMAGHLLPLSLDHTHDDNTAVAASGMAVFFILSGFLIAHNLHKSPAVRPFLVRRLARILPLAWLVLPIAMWHDGATGHEWLSELLFYANLPPSLLSAGTAHFWSLCVEMQFYAVVALVVAFGGRRALWLLPLLAVLVTVNRIMHGTLMSIDTPLRADEILAGSMLALLHAEFPRALKAVAGRLPTLLLFVLLVCAGDPRLGALNYARPYFAMLAVASTLVGGGGSMVRQVLHSAALRYVAEISYALYIFHACLMATWLGAGSMAVKYMKRPLLVAVAFALAHLSTRHYEKRWIDLGKRLALRVA